MAIFVTIFTIYLIPGLWGAIKNYLRFPPPMTYSESPNGIGTSGGNSTKCTSRKCSFGSHMESIAFHDYEDGLAYVKKVGKPVLLDFTGHACVNCRKWKILLVDA